MIQPEARANTLQLYNTLTEALGGLGVEYSDAHYLPGTLPDNTPFEVDDYNSYWLKDVLVDGGLGEAGRKQLLVIGKACLNVVINPRKDNMQTYVVGRPSDIRPGFGLLEQYTRLGVEPESDELSIYNFKDDSLIEDPFVEPNLLAVYNHIKRPTIK